MTPLALLVGCSAPELSVESPTEPVARDVSVTVHSEAPVRWALGGREGAIGAGTSTLPLDGLPSGTHRARFTASGPVRETVVEVDVVVDHTPPVVELGDVGRTVEQGHTLPVFLRTDDAVTLSLRVLDEDRPLYPHADGVRALVGVPIRTPAGALPLQITAEDALGNRLEQTVGIVVEPVDWPFTGKLPLSRRKARVPSEAVQKMRSERDPVYAEDLPEARWDGPMALPVRGRHTSAFGTYREYPDGRRSHHDAEDIGQKFWTPVVAAAPGEVRLAHLQVVHGNAVLIAHGQGVVSLYSHLAGLDVEVGQQVEAGDRIGWVGSTGRSTGPHLHWGVVVDEVPVDPMQWLETGFTDPGGWSDL